MNKIIKCTSDYSKSQKWTGMELEVIGLCTGEDGEPTGQVAVKVVKANLRLYPSYPVGRVCPMSPSAVAFYLGGETGARGGRGRGKSASFKPYTDNTDQVTQDQVTQDQVTQDQVTQ